MSQQYLLNKKQIIIPPISNQRIIICDQNKEQKFNNNQIQSKEEYKNQNPIGQNDKFKLQDQKKETSFDPQKKTQTLCQLPVLNSTYTNKEQQSLQAGICLNKQLIDEKQILQLLNNINQENQLREQNQQILQNINFQNINEVFLNLNNQYQQINNQNIQNINNIKEYENIISQNKNSIKLQEEKIIYLQNIEEKNIVDMNTLKQENNTQKSEITNKLNQLNKLQEQNEKFYQSFQNLQKQQEFDNNNFLSTIDSKNTQIEQLKKNNNDLLQNNQQLKQKNDALMLQNQQNTLKIQEKEQEIKKLSQQFDNYQEEMNQNKKEHSLLLLQKNEFNQSLVKDLEIQKQSINNLQNLQKASDDQLQKYSLELEIKTNKIKKQEEIIQDIQKQLNIFIEEKQKLNRLIPKKQLSQYGYDMIIQIKSLFDLQICDLQNEKHAPGLKVQKFNSQFDPELQNVVVVGFLGFRNKGKTFLLNSLINSDFPSDFHSKTPGVSIKLQRGQNKNTLYFDSEGLGNPISVDYQNNEYYKSFIKNKRNNNHFDQTSKRNLEKEVIREHCDVKAIEQIRQQFIIQNTTVLIIVVSMLTLQDQKLIYSISEQFVQNNKESKNQKKIFVVHNLQEMRRLEYIKVYLDELKNKFPIKEHLIDDYQQQNEEKYFNTVFYDELRPHITHIVMGQENSDAGRFYNQFAIYYIKQQISSHQLLNNFNIVQNLKQCLNKNLKNYVHFQNEKKQITDSKQNDDEKELLEYQPESEKIVLKKGIRIERIQELQVNIQKPLQKEFSYSIVNSSKNKNKEEMYLFVEIPGTSKFSKKYEKQNGRFVLQISQSKELEDGVGEIKATTRMFEEQHIFIPICNGKELWNYKPERDLYMNDGVYQFVFEKEDNDDFY